uniref:BED-type domain-containing protein n=1 Tax=Amphiprion percula TaxID=161767 RepID=A0A3P8T2G1_AMPPE
MEETSRKRSVVWSFFKSTDCESLQCLLCSSFLQKNINGSTTSMLRHLRVRHPTVVRDGQMSETTTSNDMQDMDVDEEQQFCSVEVVLEDGDSDITAPVNETGVNSADINRLLDVSKEGPAEQMARSEADDDRPVLRMQHKRSLIWKYFELLESLNAARCRICMKKLQYSYGGTSNLRRHLSKRHPKVFSALVAKGKQTPPLNSSQDSKTNGDTDETVRMTEQRRLPVEVALEDGDSDIVTAVNEMRMNSADISGFLDVSQEGPAEQMACSEMSNDRSVGHTQHKRSLIWRYFEHLDGLNAARCRICMKKLQYSYGSTSNLRRHLLKRHPKVFSALVANRQQTPPLNSSQDSKTNGDTDEIFWMTEQRRVPGALKVSGASEGERRVFRRERELIEALRRAQREEARALEHQRELLERLRAADAREAAAEREKIESLRKAQQEEANELSRQREELQKEKAELHKKWEELQQEREGLLLLSRGQ